MNAKFPMREKSTLPAYHVEICECKFGVLCAFEHFLDIFTLGL